MDFVTLSKVLPVLIFPFFVMLWLMLIAMILLIFRRTRAGAVCVAVAVAVAVVCGNPTLANRWYAQHERTYSPLPPADYPEADVIIVLGGTLSPPLRPRTTFDITGPADRIREGTRLYKAGRAPNVLLAGGNVFPQPGVEPESFYMAALIQEWGVPDSAISIEGRSRNTYENAIYARKLMEDKGFQSALLVTSALHMPRALAVFRCAGIDAIAAPTDYLVVDANRPRVLNWLPGPEPATAPLPINRGTG